MFFVLLIPAIFGMPMLSASTQLPETLILTKQQGKFKYNESQALNIKLDYGTSPEPQRLSRREKISLKLTQITKITTD
jgi:hypothetical protein